MVRTQVILVASAEAERWPRASRKWAKQALITITETKVRKARCKGRGSLGEVALAEVATYQSNASDVPRGGEKAFLREKSQETAGFAALTSAREGGNCCETATSLRGDAAAGQHSRRVCAALAGGNFGQLKNKNFSGLLGRSYDTKYVARFWRGPFGV